MKENEHIMPITKQAYRRFMVIDSCLTNKMKRYPTMDEILEACRTNLDIDPSPETIQKDIRDMKLPDPDGFDAPIRFCRKNKGYEYTDPNFSIRSLRLQDNDIAAIKESIDLLHNIGGSRMSRNFSHSLEKVLANYREDFPSGDIRRRIVQNDTPPESRGFENFDFFYNACNKRIPVSLIHYSYTKRNFKSVILHPILLKEFDNRWYIVGYSEDHKGIRTFGLDRVYDPILLKKKYISADSEDQLSYFKDVYGVYPIEGQIKQIIRITTNSIATNYFQAYPIHASQKVKKNSRGTAEISFELIPSMELLRLFRSYGSEIIDIRPMWISTYVRKTSFQ